MASKSGRRPRGFTLIEVLVVVAIIALLVSILLPSLRRVREQARELACGANLSQIGKGMIMYANTQKEFIPGSPLTTGRWFVEAPSSNVANNWQPFFRGFNRYVVEWFDYATPIRKEMFGANIAPKPQNITQVNKLRQKLFSEATDGIFHCPSNPELSVPYNSEGNASTAGYPTIRATSYLTMQSIVKGGPEVYRRPPGRGANPPYQFAIGIGGVDDEILPPENYLPQLPRIGRRLDMKVFLADGVRFFDPDCSITIDCENGVIDYNISPSATKGFLTATPPSVRNFSSSGTESREYTVARRYSYRHGKSDRMQSLFFDGHVAGLRVDVSGKTNDGGGFRGEAVQPRYYWPSGSIVREPNELHLGNIPVDTLLP